MEDSLRNRKISWIINIGLVSNLLLAIAKTTAGILGHSAALLADGINSTSDVVYYIFAKIFIGMSQKPADKEHPYGHKQFESIATIVIGAFIITTAIAVLWDAINKTFDYFAGNPDNLATGGYTLYIALISVVVKIVLAKISFGVAKKVNNSTVMAIAYDHRNDIISSLMAVIGIVMGKFGYYWVDPLAGALVALIILRTGISIINSSSQELMLTTPDDKIADQLKGIILRIPEVKEIEMIKATMHGPFMVINLIIGLDGAISVREGDAIATQVENALYKANEYIKEVHIHYHPAKPI